MRAQQLVDGDVGASSVVTGKAVREAFDRAWATISYKHVGDPSAREKARLRLAECVLAATRDGDTDSEQIERLAVMMFRIVGRQATEQNNEPA